MSMSGTLSSGGVPKNPTFGTVIATSSVILTAGATFDLYNTADQTTNYERLRADWSGNIARIWTGFGGSAAARVLQVGTSVSVGSTAPSNFIQFGAVSGINIRPVGGSGAGPFLDAFSTLNASSGAQTFFSNIPTINQSGTAGYTALDINPTETATGSGTKLLQRWAVGGTAVAQMSNGGVLWAPIFYSTNAIGFTTALGGSGDVTLFRDAADTLALRRSTNAQTFRVYNTYTDASNYERSGLGWVSNVTRWSSEAAGTGTVRNMEIVRGSTTHWLFNSSGNNFGAHLLASADNTYDIGASGANRPRNLYIGGSASFGQYYGSAIAFTVATLSAAGLVSRARAFVSDSTVAAAGNFGAIVAGGGANIVPVYSDGTNWRIG